MMTLFDDEQILKAYTKDIEENAERKMAKKKVIQMIEKGKISMAEVREYFPELSESDVKELEAEVMQLI